MTDQELVDLYAGRRVSINTWHVAALRRIYDAARNDSLEEAAAVTEGMHSWASGVMREQVVFKYDVPRAIRRLKEVTA